ncbi:hypothetical protein [Mastigocladopsis repens]|uniref:hypothetical protein n=1 Tax=Mastigocladopsis repens TaxID=221287 RepID=UPI0012EAD70B|nr:hypothetical protein [Mastigocladopsis repens]
MNHRWTSQRLAVNQRYAGGFPDPGDWCKSCGQGTPTPSGVPQAYPEGPPERAGSPALNYDRNCWVSISCQMFQDL